jgi:competence protein ComEA
MEENMRNIFIIVCAALFLLTGCTSARYESDIVLNDVSDEGSKVFSDENCDVGDYIKDVAQEEVPTVQETIWVYVCGAVKCPGVYELSAASRANDAILAAGGFAEDADETFVNLAAKIDDGTKLMIPTKDEVANGVITENLDVSSSSGNNGLININTATKEELKSIPGIGEKVAGKIVDYREKNGKFSCKEDIMKVSGIKDKLFSKIEEYITV